MLEKRFGYWLLLTVGVLLVPIVPFLMLHGVIERWLAAWAAEPPDPWVVAGLVVGILSTDVFLPVPSSLVSTLAGSQLGLLGATFASWLGLNLGAAVGLAVGRGWGRAFAERLAGRDELERMQPLAARLGASLLILTRALPILAEATVLLLGVQRLPWRKFWPPVLLSNLGIAIAYAWMGSQAAENEWLPYALAVSVALPLGATWLVKKWKWG